MEVLQAAATLQIRAVAGIKVQCLVADLVEKVMELF
jgi:hypothetical protein